MHIQKSFLIPENSSSGVAPDSGEHIARCYLANRYPG